MKFRRPKPKPTYALRWLDAYDAPWKAFCEAYSGPTAEPEQISLVGLTDAEKAYHAQCRGDYAIVRTDDLHIRESVFQFRKRTVPDFPTWRPEAVGIISTWIDAAGEIGEPGRVYVVNGHHRVMKAQALNAVAPTVPLFETRRITASTAREAAACGALENLRDSPQVDSLDVANYLRNCGATNYAGHLREAGVSLNRSVIRDGALMAKLPDAVFQTVYAHADAVRGLRSVAAAVAEFFSDPADAEREFALYYGALRAGRSVNRDMIEEKAKALTELRAGQFGFDFDLGDLDVRARVVAAVKRAFADLVAPGRRFHRESVASFYALTDGQKRSAVTALEVAEIVDRTAHIKSPLGALVTAAVRAVEEGEEEDEITSRLVRVLQTGEIVGLSLARD